MYCKLTTCEKLADLRKARGYTLSDLSARTGISVSALGDYENNEYKDIPGSSLEILARHYGVSIDYLKGITENSTEALTPLAELHLSDEAVAVLKSGLINNRLLSEMIAHTGFRKFMTDSEIYVDRIVEIRIKDMSTMLETVRSRLIGKAGADPEDLYMSTLKTAQLSDTDFLGQALKEDLMDILSDIRESHVTDSTTADSTGTDMVRESLTFAEQLSESPKNKKIIVMLQALGIPYSTLSEEEFRVLVNVLGRSNTTRPNPNMCRKLSHGRGKKKRKIG